MTGVPPLRCGSSAGPSGRCTNPATTHHVTLTYRLGQPVRVNTARCDDHPPKNAESSVPLEADLLGLRASVGVTK